MRLLVRVAAAVGGGLLAGFVGGLLRGRRPSAPGAGYIGPVPARDTTAVAGPDRAPEPTTDARRAG